MCRANLASGKKLRPFSCGQNEKLLRFPKEIRRFPISVSWEPLIVLEMIGFDEKKVLILNSGYQKFLIELNSQYAILDMTFKYSAKYILRFTDIPR